MLSESATNESGLGGFIEDIRIGIVIIAADESNVNRRCECQSAKTCNIGVVEGVYGRMAI